MTMVNLPALFFFYAVVVAGFYGLLGLAVWAVGELSASPRARGFGTGLASAAAGTFVGYTALIVVWYGFAEELIEQGMSGSLVMGLFATAPALLFVPPIWAIVRSTNEG